MRFMMIVKSNPEQDKKTIADKRVSEQLIGEMRKYNEQLANAGVLLDLSGLHGTSKGTRIKFSPGGKKTVVDGPFTESKELVAGFWIIDVKSREEAIEWAKRARRRTVRTRSPKSKYENLLNSKTSCRPRR